MNKELYVSSTPHETKVALVEDDQLAEVFFERDNEYTLAGSIYKGRVTRVLPGMQSAFVEIGLERDAFLYVSDFLELGDEEDSEEFGEIPAPRTTVNLIQSPQATGPRAEPPADEESEFLAAVEGVQAIETENEAEVTESAASPAEDQTSGEGARRWRGRRRRGGRRGGRDEHPERAGPKVEAAKPEEQPTAGEEPVPEASAEHGPESRPDSRPAAYGESRTGSRGESRSRSDFGPPPGYSPMVLPGESISKYRNMVQALAEQTAAVAEESEEPTETVVTGALEDFVPAVEAHDAGSAIVEVADEQIEAKLESTVAQPEPLTWTAGETDEVQVVEELPVEAASEVEADAVRDQEEDTARLGASGALEPIAEVHETQVAVASEEEVAEPGK